MQEHYFHSVPQMKENTEDDYCRMVIVFRTGDQVSFSRDTGRACTDLSPRKPKIQTFGNGVPGIEEGCIYTRAELFKNCAHLMQQRGISGNMKDGCDAIIVSGLREDKLGTDDFLKLMYAAESVKGALSVLCSFEQNKPIRIFRSSIYNSPFRAIGRNSKLQRFYRYDGLYRVVKFKRPDHDKGPYQFELERAEAGQDDFLNNIPNIDFTAHCQKLGTLLVCDGVNFQQSTLTDGS